MNFKNLIPFLLVAFVLIPSNNFGSHAVQSNQFELCRPAKTIFNNEIHIDIYKAGISNTGTNNMIYYGFSNTIPTKAEVFQTTSSKSQSDRLKSERIGASRSGIQPDSKNPKKTLLLGKLNSYDFKFKYVYIGIKGDDGFWIDQVIYKSFRSVNSRFDGPPPGWNYATRVIRKWGKDGGKGYCFSTDPTDANRSWKDHVSGCYSYIVFDVASGSAVVRK